MPVIKIDHKSIVESLLKSVSEIEASEDPQREKTIAFKAAATRYINALYKDARIFSRGAGIKRRISLDTAQRYISNARKKIENLNITHHLLPREMERLKARYPLHSDVIDSLNLKDPTQIRITHKHLTEQISAARDILPAINQIDFSKKGVKRQLSSLAKKHPIYQEFILNLDNEDPAKALANLQKVMRERDKLSSDLIGLKINHEILYHMVLPAEDAAILKNKRSGKLEDKKNSVVSIDYKSYISRISGILRDPENSLQGSKGETISALTFALCGATGRRPIEIISQGEFSVIDKNRMEFSGQAKKRFDEETNLKRWFYTLIDADTVLKAIEVLRGSERVSELLSSVQDQADLRSENTVINNKTSSYLNAYAKKFFDDKERTIKDLRSIWVRSVYDIWFVTDDYWKSKDEDVFFSEMLGQSDPTVQMHYKAFKVINASLDFVSDNLKVIDRVEELEKIDEGVSALSRGDSAEQLHEKVKQAVKDDKYIKITQSLLTKAPFNANRAMVKRYLGFAQKALGIILVNGRWAQADLAHTSEVVIESSEQSEQSKESKAKPLINKKQNDDGSWYGEVVINNKIISTAHANTAMEAMKNAWSRAEQDYAKVSSKKVNDGWQVSISAFDRVIYDSWIKGGKKEAESAALKSFNSQ